jgi:hypothetical protein
MAPRGASNRTLRRETFTRFAAVPNSPNVWALGGDLIELWNGSAWSVVTAPHGGLLSGVAAVSNSDAWAVGEPRSGFQPFIAHWNGQAWTAVRSPKMATNARLNSVVALSADDVWAVGSTLFPPAEVLTLTDHWDGKAWSVVPSPNPQGSSGAAGLGAVTSSGGALFAVGSAEENGSSLPLVEKWTGSSWQIVTGPQTNGSSAFDSVTADASGGIWAAGWTSSPSAQIPLLAHFDGARWTVAATANPTDDSKFAGIARAPGRRDVWAVGQIGNGAQGFTERCPG